MNPESNETNILIADDTPEHIRIAARILKDLGCPIRAAIGGAQAMRQIARQVPTLLLLDISLRDIDGFEICRQVKADPRCQDTAIIFVTANTEEASVRKGFEAGAQDYVTKPYLPSELYARAGTQLRLAAKSQEGKAAYRELDQFCHTVSHDLKSPLLTIRQLGAMLTNSLPPGSPEDCRTIVRLLDDKCGQTIAMIDRLLEFSRMTRRDCDLRPTELAPLFQQVFDELTALEPDRDIRLELAPIPTVRADQVLVKQLIQNVLGNAIKFTRPRPQARITVSCGRKPGATVIQVADNGVGFDMSYADKLFGVFERLHSAEEFEGSGVGLAIVGRIMKTHGGSASITAAPGEGATVTLRFPA